MSIKINEINSVNHIHSLKPGEEAVVDLNSRVTGIREVQAQENSEGPGTDWNKEIMERMIMQFAHAMYDPESEIYIGERDIF